MAALVSSPMPCDKRIPFGKSMLKAFCMSPDYTNLNARKFSSIEWFSRNPGSCLITFNPASCGSWPKAVSDQFRDLWAQLEAQPDLFSEFSQGPMLQQARLAISELVHAAESECIFVPNATTGIFTVLYNYEFEKLDVVVTLSTTYGAIDHGLTSLADHRPLQVRKVDVGFPTTYQEIVSQFEATVAGIKAEGLRPRLAVLETVVSIPAVRMPFEELLHVCHREGIMTLVDGAHSVGQFEVNLAKLQPDFFVADCHKYVTYPIKNPCPHSH